MATVYLAEDLRHHRQVAVKVLREELGYARYLDLRRNADPSLKTQVDQVKDALKRLTAEGN